MRWLVFSILVSQRLFCQSPLTEEALRALQQLEDLMPERLWMQEFSVLIDQQAFEAHIKKQIKEERLESKNHTEFLVGSSKDYFLFDTMSGDPIRISDQYQIFEEGIFYNVPAWMDELKCMEE